MIDKEIVELVKAQIDAAVRVVCCLDTTTYSQQMAQLFLARQWGLVDKDSFILPDIEVLRSRG